MATPDMEVIKEIPGYKVILKAVLKNQIQQLVEQLATSTDEESVILTASVADGTLSHLGSNSGKVFLEDHEDIKSQFLGFCLKRHHKQKQERQEKERQEAFARSIPVTPPRYGDMGGRPGFMSQRSPRFTSPRHQGSLHPVAMRASGPGIHSSGVRHEPYPMMRPQRRASLDQQGRGSGPAMSPGQGAMRFPVQSKLDGQVIKIEPGGDDEHSNQSAEDGTAGASGTDAGSVPSSSQPVSPSGRPSASSQSKGEPSDKDDDAKSESSTSTIPNEASDMKFSDTAPPGGLSLDSDLSNLISQESCSGLDSNIQLRGSAHESSFDPNVIVKRESMADSEMDLEITGVELGQSFSGSSEAHDWVQNIQNPMGGATGSPGDMTSQQGYSEVGLDSPFQDVRALVNLHVPFTGLYEQKPTKYPCRYCGKYIRSKYDLAAHERSHTGEKPYECQFCGKTFSRKENMKAHSILHININNSE